MLHKETKVMNNILYFNEADHIYTNEVGLQYTSMTTVIGKYEHPFDTKAKAQACYNKYYRRVGHRYYNMTVPMILDNWGILNADSLDRGNDRHNFLEDLVKESSGYNRTGKRLFINDRIYTIEDILQHHQYGIVSIDYFIKKGLHERYPDIFAILKWHHDNGYRIYSEIGVFNNELMVSGLIDILLVKGNSFRILDWKTNKAKLHFDSGYYKRDSDGKNTTLWVPNDDRFKAPLAHIPESHGNTYTLQLSGYAWLIEQFGLKLDILILCHIRPEELDEFGNIHKGDENDIVDIVPIKYFKDDVALMFRHHFNRYAKKQTTLNI